jgi:hypothetical protein
MSEETTDTKEETTTEVSTSKAMDIKAICEMAEKMEVSTEELVTNYYDFTVGEEIRILPLGAKRIAKLNMVDAIRFLNINDGEFYISAAAVIVSSLKEAAIANKEGNSKKFYNVTCIGEKSSSKGKYQTFSIKPLV